MLTHWKDPDAGRNWGKEEKGMTEDEMAGWHHRFDGYEFGWTPGVGDGQGGLVCCDLWGRKSQTQLSAWTELNWKEINPEYSLEGLMLKLKLWYFGYLMQRADSLEKTWLMRKDPDAGKDWRPKEKGTKEDEMVRWHHWLNGYEFGWTPGVGNGQGGLACHSPWGH